MTRKYILKFTSGFLATIAVYVPVIDWLKETTFSSQAVNVLLGLILALTAGIGLFFLDSLWDLSGGLFEKGATAEGEYTIPSRYERKTGFKLTEVVQQVQEAAEQANQAAQSSQVAMTQASQAAQEAEAAAAQASQASQTAMTEVSQAAQGVQDVVAQATATMKSALASLAVTQIQAHPGHSNQRPSFETSLVSDVLRLSRHQKNGG